LARLRDVAAESRYTSGLPLIRRSRMGKSCDRFDVEVHDGLGKT
jgi:hypothetical protein